jgi:glutamate dehydrogenase/leucine dehydrogenase
MAATVLAGAANNPLADRGMARALADRGVLYVPDFIANCGGIIHVGAEVLGLSAGEVEELLAGSGRRSESILSKARETGRLPLQVAEEYALTRMQDAGSGRQMTGGETDGRDDRRSDIVAGRH